MSLPRFFSDEAFVLKRTNYSEADRLLTIFTKNHGKLFAIAKGSRRSTSKKAPHIELFTLTKLHFMSNNNFLMVTQAETINNFLLLKTDLAPVRAAFHLNELIDQLLLEGESYPEVFNSFVILFKALNQNDLSSAHRQKLITNFQIEILNHLGFGQPEKLTTSSVYAYMEEVLDRRLKAAKSLL